ncbi:hypothetical protein [Hymenobacter chitinivorans]|uniref:TonB C-terminal domain-containing protein n=1 Tax=Hymenobacter chitinivorans DSM 11115 TaxID=1121954 RepID=A0A2M9BST4_9BACT|nr:hypothetical protein [Hymenobacter chitinivorans]PJJ61020.1 hypothetical protein CLV45_2457 [Hymenobacter chitinivorans DSM 11115]
MHRLLLCCLALLLAPPLARAQYAYKPLPSACRVGPFYHFDRGQPRAQFGQDLTAYFTNRIPTRLYRNFKGLVLVEVHVDSLGQPCALRLADHTFGSDPALLNLPALIGAMPRWSPARLSGKPVNMGVALRFTFGNQALAVDYNDRDDHDENPRTSGVPSPLHIANKTQRYLPAPARIRVQAFTTQNSALPWDQTFAVAAAADRTLWAGTMNGLVHAGAGR